MRKIALIVPLIALMLTMSLGCSNPAQFTKVALPLATDIYQDQIEYLDADPDSDPEWRLTANLWLDSVTVGLIDNTSTYWHAGPGVRSVQMTYLTNDPRRNQAGGTSWYTIKIGAIADFDFILSQPH